MAEVAWGEEGEAPRKKKRVPTWVWWGCGGGCLLMVLAAIALTITGAFFFREARDPEKQWPKLAELLPFDQRPEHLELELGFNVGVRQFHLVDTANHIRAQLTEFPNQASAGQMMDPGAKGPMGLGTPVDPEGGTLAIQGRDVPYLRFSRIKPEPEEMGPGIRLDLTGERSKPLILELRRIESEERISDEEVVAFLAPFDVWRGR